MDVKPALLNGKIEEEVYIEQPEGFVTHGEKSHVCKPKSPNTGTRDTKDTGIRVSDTGTVTPGIRTRYIYIYIFKYYIY